MLPPVWVDRLFAKLTVRYGQAFMRQYADLDPALVKADWAEVLAGFESNTDPLRYAIENLPDSPPSAMQFRAIARRSPPPPVTALPSPSTDKPPQQIRELAHRLRRRPTLPAQECIDNIERRVRANGGRITEPQRYMVAHCLRVPGTSTTLPVGKAGALQDAEETP